MAVVVTVVVTAEDSFEAEMLAEVASVSVAVSALAAVFQPGAETVVMVKVDSKEAETQRNQSATAPLQRRLVSVGALAVVWVASVVALTGYFLLSLLTEVRRSPKAWS